MTALQSLHALDSLSPARRVGRVHEIMSTHIEATGPLCSLGDVCEIQTDDGGRLAEVAAIKDARVVLVPFEQANSIQPGARVEARSRRSGVPVGDAFAGRIVNAFGAPLDGLAAPLAETSYPVEGRVLAPLDRQEPSAILETGIRAIDAMTPIGRGQRIGVFSASGVGKTSLIRQLIQQSACDRIVVCLVGERGREVELIWSELSKAGRANAYTCVAATSDQTAPMRTRAVASALALGEYWRDRGEHVLLIVDSVTRYAMALREIGLAAGAPPTQRAYTPNVFAALPRLVERCGASKAGGAISAIFTVLAETDDVDDPIAEAMKALLDGHIVLSRVIAEQGRFPAVDILRSVSRQAERLSTPAHSAAARRVTAILSAYEDARLMIESGVYKSGASAEIDTAIRERPRIVEFLRQTQHDRTPLEETLRRLSALGLGGGARV
ncbi:MAG: FliI/YscN family ATPase [Terricaulis sp.]